MKTIKLLFSLMLTAVTQLSAETPYQKLVDLNAEWTNHYEACNSNKSLAGIDGEVNLIRQHLTLVHQSLAGADVSYLSEQQKQNRQASLKELKEYAARGEFPQNRSYDGRRPVFIDHRGVHCAVGYLIMRSGHSSLSTRISQNMNYAYLQDMQDEGLAGWVQQSGFTLDELAWIQPAYQYPVNYKPLKGGVNGPVNAILPDNGGGLLVGGSFDSAGSFPAVGLANYISGIAGFDWLDFLDTEVSGTVHDLIYYKNELYMAGNFYMVDSVFVNSGVVKWDGSKWEVVGDFYTGALVNYVLDLEIYRDTLYAGGFFRANFTVPAAEYFESIAKWNGTEWVHAGVNLTGEVRKMHVHDGKLVIGGGFQLNMGAPIQNACMLDSTGVSFFAQSPGIAVNDIATFNNELFIATDFTNQAMTDTMGLAVYRNNGWQTLFDGVNTSKFSNGGIKALKAVPSANSLVFGGDFWFSTFGTYGENIAFYRNSALHNLGSVDSTVRVIEEVNGSLFMGGDFTSGSNFQGSVALNHIAELLLTPNFEINEQAVGKWEIYPNPTTASFTLKGSLQNWKEFELFDMQGRSYPVEARQTNAGWKFDTHRLAPGAYILKAGSADGAIRKWVIIE